MSEAKSFLDENKIQYRETDDHFQINCFLCNDERERLGVNKLNSKWNCFNCGKRGSKLSTLQYAYNNRTDIKKREKSKNTEKECKIRPDFHIQFHKLIYKTKKYDCARYLIKERLITKEAIKHFKLGTRSRFKKSDGESYDAGEHLAIPYLVNNKCVNIKYRDLDPEVEKKWKWKREKGGITAIFNDSAIDNLDYDNVIICESEIDCMSLWCLGVENVVGLTAGAEGFKPAWLDRFERYKRIHILLDNDEKGQEGAEKLAKKLGLGRCYNVLLPDDVKDPNDYIKKYSLKHFKDLLSTGERFDVDKVKPVTKVLKDLFYKKFISKEDSEKSLVDTPWGKINKILGPVKEGHLWVLCGKPKSGKTTLALNLMKYWGKKLKTNTGIYSCEMRDERLGEKWVMMETPYAENFETIDEYQFQTARYNLPHKYMHTFYPTSVDELEVDRVVEIIEETVQRYNLKVMVIDNLHFLCRGEDENRLISQATQKFKLLSERLDVVILLIVHPRKTNGNKQLKMEDMKGSSSIFQDADIIWLMYREMLNNDMTPDEAAKGVSEGAMSERADIDIAGRWTEGGRTFLAFNGRLSTFLDKGKKYADLAKELSKKKKKKGI